jgi:SAM-dependent methyltransferase
MSVHGAEQSSVKSPARRIGGAGRRLGAVLRLVRLLGRAMIAALAGWIRGAPGQRFGVFGRVVGLRAVIARRAGGSDLLLTPVNIVRYWEFPFALRHLPRNARSFLDVGSPRLLSLYVASRQRSARLRVINPDVRDAEETAGLATMLGLTNVGVDTVFVAALAGDPRRYDAIWSISVVEHMAGDGDREAMALMYDALAPGGRLLVTVPVDRRAWAEFRDSDIYGLGLPREPEGYFFQRWYDEASVRGRLIDPIGPDRVSVEWFGERVPGRFAAYEREWIRRGHARTVDDPLEIARGYRSFAGWAEMPGQGVCGIAIEKRR